MSTLCLGIFNLLIISHLLSVTKVQQILSTSGSPCIPNPNKQAIQPQPSDPPGDTTTNTPLIGSAGIVSTTMADALTMSTITTTSSLSEKIGQIERLFLMGKRI